MNLIIRLIAAAVLALFVASCATTPAKIQRIEFDDQCECSLDGNSLAHLLEFALRGTPESDHALGHFVERWQVEHGAQKVASVKVGGRDYRVEFNEGSEALAYYDRISPAIDFQLEKLIHHSREGVGATLVALRENRGQEPLERYYPPEAITRPLTAVLRTNGDRVTIDLLSPLEHRQVWSDGEAQPLAADFSVPWGMLLSRSKELERSGRKDLFKREPSRDPQLYLMQPYDPDKQPLIMVHGLRSTPLIWANLSNELWADEKIRDRYQIWHYLYNTSAPALYSGRILRNQLRELRQELDPEGDDPAMQSTTVIAHSMGGIVARSLITRPGNVFWDAAFTRPLESLDLSEPDRAALRRAFFWEPERHVNRVIYVAVPHRGSELADRLVTRAVRAFVKPPSRFNEFYRRISEANPGAFTPDYERLGQGKLDSISALSPEQPTLKILAALPNSHRVKMHSIIASEDKIVPVWSSQLDGVVSEKVVESGHRATDHPDSIAEIKRILRLVD